MSLRVVVAKQQWFSGLFLSADFSSTRGQEENHIAALGCARVCKVAGALSRQKMRVLKMC